MSAGSAEGHAALDGRQSRTARSRLAICEACLDLIQEGVLQPSADQVAERAGLSRRSIFNHFRDLAELYDAVVEVGMERCAPLLEEIPADEPLAERVDHLVRVHCAFHEATSAFTRALMAQALSSATGEQALRVSRAGIDLQHDEVSRVFEAELAHLPARDRAELLEAATGALSALQWEFLRTTRGLSVARARSTVKRSLSALLRDAGVASRDEGAA